MGRLAWTALVLEVFLGLGALGGGAALMLGPHGEILPLPVAALADSPFADYFVPGAILFSVLGVGPLVAAVLTARRSRSTPLLAVAVGIALLTWMVVEIAIVGYTNTPPLQAFYLVLGVAIVLVGAALSRTRASRRRSSAP
ncbi:MAG: hypothetical protein JNL79_23025 [Myxococcales bacterium]|nr:hypothetical protein [Myxococcales bacterium]